MSAIDLETPVTSKRRLSHGDAVIRRCSPDFEGILPVNTTEKNRLGMTEFRRRLWHMLPGLLPIILWAIPHRDPLSPLVTSIVIGCGVGIALAIIVRYRRIARQEDEGRASCAIGYAGSVIAAILLFPSAAEIGFGVLAILAFGDGSATLGGKLLGGPPLPWNREKTWSGFLSFIVVGLAMTSLIYWQETHNLKALTPGVSFSTALLCVTFPVLIAAVVESIPSRINDNVRVGVVSVATLAVSHGVIVGW